jgi:hypothetical protein
MLTALKERKNCQPRILYPAKLAIINEEEINNNKIHHHQTSKRN